MKVSARSTALGSAPSSALVVVVVVVVAVVVGACAQPSGAVPDGPPAPPFDAAPRPARVIPAVAVDARAPDARDAYVDPALDPRAARGAPVNAAGPGDADEARDPTDGACEIPAALRVERGWALEGYRPGPSLRDVAGLRRGHWLGVTARRLCVTEDQGAHWSERLAADAPLTLEPLDDDGRAFLAYERVRAPSGEPAVGRAWVSLDGEGARWTELPTPPGVDASAPRYAAFGDTQGRVFLATATALHWAVLDELVRAREPAGANPAAWQRAEALPGREARAVDACGPTVLIARARVDDEWFFHRSFDRGHTWRPLRTGIFGVEAPAALLRCRDKHGGIEGGRGLVPTHETDDGGRTWARTTRYDAVAQRAVRGDPAPHVDPEDLPRCVAAPGAAVACLDPGRIRILAGGDAQEIRAPGSCTRVRPVDDRRVVAFGPACGVLFSADRGGRWRRVSLSPVARASLEVGPAAPSGEGRAGFVDARTAWRLDEGLWWTTDGGERWAPVPSSHARGLSFGAFVDAQRGVFAARDGWVLSTGDAGHTFTYVLRGDVQRIATAGPTVVVTTATAVRVSRDGGLHWALPRAVPVPGVLDPTLEVRGDTRTVRFSSGAEVSQRGGELVVRRAGGAEPETLVRELPAQHALLAAWADAHGEPARVLLGDGLVLARSAHARR